tara:strand:- start:78 stop:611 length:534 start_codon:yes stop_codon:yes gene_type:complete
MATTKEMIEIALKIKPAMVTLVPEKREEITTEGGLNISGKIKALKDIISKIQGNGIPVSVFIDPLSTQVEAAKEIGAKWIEIHTGSYAEANLEKQPIELAKIQRSVLRAKSLGLRVNAGHGLTYQNVESVAAIEGIEELNIGHTIIARSIAVGLKEAVQEMKNLIINPRKDNLFGAN